ncbi:MAG: hypothetical protein GXY67_12080 [Clostridiales bacterium]|nr:hypothetical protein [Clostridiales bacterium]
MNKELVEIIRDQTVILLHNVKIAILTCDLEYVLCDMPLWKHVYHALHSCDQWFINPNSCPAEPPFHEPGLNSLDVQSNAALSRETLLAYYEQIRGKIQNYLGALQDEDLPKKPDHCPYTRMALILGQYRHLYAHLGNINATTMLQTGRWPRVVGLDGNLSRGLYE